MRNSIRSLTGHPGFTVVAVLTIALGIAATTAIFSVVNGVLLRPLPYPGADRIVQVWTTGRGDAKDNHDPAGFLEFQQRTQRLERLAGYREDALTLAPEGVDPVRITGALVTVDFFEVMGVAAVQGRTFGREDAERREPLAVISARTWRDTLASDPAVVGRLLRINSVPHTVVGVMPDTFDYPLGTRAWILSTRPVPPPPFDVKGDLLEARDLQYFLAIGRLKPAATVQQAQVELDAIAADIGLRHPRTNSGQGVLVEPLHERIVGDVRRALWVMLGAVGVVLLIACANVASLLLARGSGRQRELAIRAAVGASRGRLIRQLLLESLILAGAGGLIGLLMGTWAVELLVTVIPERVPRVEEIGLDARVAAVTLLVSLASAALFGLIPSLQASKGDTSAVLRDGGDRASTSGRRARTRAVLVVMEVALTVVLLTSAGLLANSFLRLQRIDPGFDADRVTLVQLPLPQGQYVDGKAQAGFYQRVLDGLNTRGEIEMAAVVFPDPLAGGKASGSFSVDGRVTTNPAERPRANLAAVSTDYLRTMGIALLAGRHFTSQDQEPAPIPVIVNAALARRIWPGEDPLGRRIRFDDTVDEWLTVVGIAADSRNRGLDIDPEPLIYIPYQAFTLPFMSIVARSPGGTSAVATAVRAEVRKLDPEMPIDSVRSMKDVVSESVSEPRFRTVLIGVFAATALALAAIGVYGLISYSVALRTREIGIRVALGARPAQVVGPIVREGMALAVMGVGLGLAGAFLTTKVIAAFLFGIEATDPLTFAAVAVLLLAVALLASYIPSRRALAIDPLTALRSE